MTDRQDLFVSIYFDLFLLWLVFFATVGILIGLGSLALRTQAPQDVIERSWAQRLGRALLLIAGCFFAGYFFHDLMYLCGYYTGLATFLTPNFWFQFSAKVAGLAGLGIGAYWVRF